MCYGTKNIPVLRYFVQMAKRLIVYKKRQEKLGNFLVNTYTWKNGEIYVQTRTNDIDNPKNLGKSTVMSFSEFWTRTYKYPKFESYLSFFVFSFEIHNFGYESISNKEFLTKGEDITSIRSYEIGAPVDFALDKVDNYNFSIFVRYIRNITHGDAFLSVTFLPKTNDPKYVIARLRQNEIQKIPDMLRLGYVKKDEQGRIFIGCLNCESQQVAFKLECCPHVTYCSKECARDDWKNHSC